MVVRRVVGRGVVRIERVGAPLQDLVAVAVAVLVGFRLIWSSAQGPDVDAVDEAVTVPIRIECGVLGWAFRFTALGRRFLAVPEHVLVGIHVAGVEPDLVFQCVGDPVAVRVEASGQGVGRPAVECFGPLPAI